MFTDHVDRPVNTPYYFSTDVDGPCSRAHAHTGSADRRPREHGRMMGRDDEAWGEVELGPINNKKLWLWSRDYFKILPFVVM